ncbi:MAG: hypothetical protein ABI528_00985 [bacterium]
MKTFHKFVLSLTLLINLIFITTDSNSTTINVAVSNFTFNPLTFTIAVGDTIKWNWVNGNHTTTCDGSPFTGRPAGAPGWNSAINTTLNSYKYIVSAPGLYSYKCIFHAPNMAANFTAVNMYVSLNLTTIIEGLWNGTTMVRDTVNTFLRASSSPYQKIDSAKLYLDNTGNASVYFTHAASGLYFIAVDHRNSIQTWSKFAYPFNSSSTITYNFTTAADKAFGDNLKLKLAKFTNFSGDRNQDESIDITDLVDTYNDGNNFITGYVLSDMNGDFLVDVADNLIVYNNMINFVVVMRP